MYRTVTTKQFNKYLSDLKKKGKKGKDAILKTKAAIADAGMEGAITSVTRTKHGESRLPNIEKYDLGDGYRLVVQLVNPGAQERAFLFVGDHEDADRWLDNHQDYKWVAKESDKTLEFVQVSVSAVSPTAIPDFDLDSPESLLDLPLLRDITGGEWKSAGVPVTISAYLCSVTANGWEQDPSGILGHIEGQSSIEMAWLALDLLGLAHRREWDAVHRRLDVAAGEAAIVSEAMASNAMVAPENSERFVTWTDLAQLPENTEWSEWMLFLHPEQKEFVGKAFNGPTRLRGVSGSGKTCVMIHRARHLARKYKQSVLLVTLTESMRKLLELLVKQLCGVEATYIKSSTVMSLAREIMNTLIPDGEISFQNTGDFQKEALLKDALRGVRFDSAFPETVLSKLSDDELKDFLDDEIAYVRTRFLPNEYQEYLTIKRYGRELALPEKARTVILSAVKDWDQSLRQVRTTDFESIAQTALGLLSQPVAAVTPNLRYRCVLVDEVQDLSQLEMRILANIPTTNGERVVDVSDGLFLVGDGAQTIYRRGFTLKACGISVANRSFVLQKNYRNTREILEAAYGLIQSYEFADVDEENVQTPTAPHWSSRHGEKPLIVKCSSPSEECAFVVSVISEMIEERNASDDAEEIESASDLPICVIGFNQPDRDRFVAALAAAHIPVTVLKDDVSWQNTSVKISTLESAKGHEFHAVFIVGVKQGTMPHFRVPESDWKREAARLYVGMTRARDRLYLSYDAGGQYGPSPFLAAIQDDCHKCEFKNGKLSPSND